jgi:hypothetical protein
MALTSARQMAAQISRVAVALDDKSWHSIVGAQAKDNARTAVRSDLGDLSMSNWRPSKPIQLGSRWDSDGDGIIVQPRPLGPWRVMEGGRRPGMSKQRRGRKSRRVGATAGKQTWSNAVSLMSRDVPKKIAKAKVAAVRKAWK